MGRSAPVRARFASAVELVGAAHALGHSALESYEPFDRTEPVLILLAGRDGPSFVWRQRTDPLPPSPDVIWIDLAPCVLPSSDIVRMVSLNWCGEQSSNHANWSNRQAAPSSRPPDGEVDEAEGTTMTNRAQAAEEKYFRSEEAERKHFEGLELEHAAQAARSELNGAEARRVRRAARHEEIFPHARRDARRRLNRLIVASWDESLTFDEAIRFMHDANQRRDLEQHLEQRRAFRLVLGDAVVAWGGLPAGGASFGARCWSWARSVRRLASGAHGGDAYAACAHATEHARSEYDGVLRLRLPLEMRLSIERQRAQLVLDAGKLRRLRWGANERGASDASDAMRAQSSSP